MRCVLKISRIPRDQEHHVKWIIPLDGGVKTRSVFKENVKLDQVFTLKQDFLTGHVDAIYIRHHTWYRVSGICTFCIAQKVNRITSSFYISIYVCVIVIKVQITYVIRY